MASSPSELVVVLIDVALFEILEAEVGAEEAGGAILQGDAAVASDGRGPHPLVGGAVGMIDHQQSDAFHLGGCGEADHAPCCCRRSRGASYVQDFFETLLLAAMTSSTPS